MYLIRYLPKENRMAKDKMTFRVEERDDFRLAMYRFCHYPKDYQMWAVFRVSDMRCLAMSKNYHHEGN